MRSAPRYRVPPGTFVRGAGSALRVPGLRYREVSREDPEYPPGLDATEDPPDRLWVAGRDLRSFGSMVTIIGARRANQYGLNQAHRLAGDLAVGGVCIVSGLARGCDAAAHDGALEAGGDTIAVLGSGVNMCYPAGSRALYAEIAERGALVSAMPPGADAHRGSFLYRNGIMVAMSVAVIVVQGDKESAAVNTGMRAAEKGRGNVFAVPGSIEWPQSHGVHDLLKAGAHVCTKAGDLQDRLRGLLQWDPPVIRPVPEHLPDDHRRILEILGRGPASRDRVVALSGLGTVGGMRAVAALELAGYVTEAQFLLSRVR